MKRFFSIILISILVVLSVPFNVFSSASDIVMPNDFAIVSNAVYLENLDTGRVVFEKNADEKVYPASTTKIMTSALALEMCESPESTIATVPFDIWDEFVGMNISTAGLSRGEELSITELVHCMMLQSANEAASTVADFFGREEFISAMNSKAKELGCKQTHFSNPHGLFGEDHYTTASDMAKITKWALGVDNFLEISEKARYTLRETNKNGEKILATTILLQDPYSKYYTPYVKGVKTGTLNQSGRCLVTIAEKNNMTYLLVLMGAPLEPTSGFWDASNSAFNETRLIYDWVFSNTHLENIINYDTPITEVPVKYSKKRDALVLYPYGDLYALLNNSKDELPEVYYELDLPENIEAPVHNSQVIGSAKVYADDILIGEVDLISREEIEYSWFSMVMSKMTNVFTSRPAVIIYIAVLLLIVLYVLYIVLTIKKNKKRS